MSQDKHVQIKASVDKSFVNTQDTRERGADDWMFAHFNQWDETLEEYSDNEYRGQFDIITRQLRQVKGEMLANPVSVKFRPSDNSPDKKKLSEVLQGMYRASMRTNAAKEAVDVGIDCQVSTGLGAWRITTEYEDQGDNTITKQMITRKPIHEANNVVFFDSQAKRKDKSDAKWGCILTWYTDEGYDDLIRDYGIDPEDRNPSTFKTPETSYVFPWTHAERHYIGEYYEVEEKKKKVFILRDQSGQVETVGIRQKAKLAELADYGFDVVDKKEIKTREVYKYVLDGQGIIDGPTKIAGKHIPIVPVFGDWRFIEGQEWWEGMVRRAKDPQRLHNMSFSFIADQVGRTPRRKPIMSPEQIKGHEHFYMQDADYPYYLMNFFTDDGQPLPQGITSYMEGPTISGTETQFLQMTEKAVQDVTVTPLVGQNALSDGVTEGQLRLANAQSQMQTFMYQDNLSTAMRRDGEIWLSIASEIYDEEDQVIIMKDDDSTEYVEINKTAFDKRGMPAVENDMSQASLEVYTDIGPRFQDLKQEAERKLGDLINGLAPNDPMRQVATLTLVNMMDIPTDTPLEKWVSQQMLDQGLREPENEQEYMAMIQKQQAAANQPNPMVMVAQAEMTRAKADVMSAQNDQANTAINAENAKSKRIQVLAQAEKYGADISKTLQEVDTEQLDNAIKVAERV